MRNNVTLKFKLLNAPLIYVQFERVRKSTFYANYARQLELLERNRESSLVLSGSKISNQ